MVVTMQFKPEGHSSFPEKNGKKVSSFINLNGVDRKAGGTIMLNKQFPINYLREALFHEYAHIKDERLPIHTTDKNAFNSKATFEKFYMEHIEFLADMDAYTLMMPPEKLKEQLLQKAYNIDEIIKNHSNIEKSSVLQWIVINSHLPCHFIYIVLEKDAKNNIKQRIDYDNCYYDQQTDPAPFPVDTILADANSAASTALRTKKDAHRLSMINDTTSNNATSYYCYAYYEQDVSKDIIHNIIPYLTGHHYDRLLVIGWTKNYHDMIMNFYKCISQPKP